MLEHSSTIAEAPVDKEKFEILPKIFHSKSSIEVDIKYALQINNQITQENSLTPLKEKMPGILYQPYLKPSKKRNSVPLPKKKKKKDSFKNPFIEEEIVIESYKDVNFMMTYDEYNDNRNLLNTVQSLSQCPCKKCSIF